MSQFSAIVKKECKDNLRDRRALFSSLSPAIFAPIFLVGLITFMLEQIQGDSEDPTEFSVIGSSYAPGLIDFLASQNTAIKEIDSTSSAKELVESGKEKVILVIKENYSSRFKSGQQNTVKIIYEGGTISDTLKHVSLLRGLINQYSSRTGLLRLQLRGIDPSIISPIRVADLDVASPAAKALSIIMYLPYLIIVTIFIGGLPLAIDTTAGEKERGTLEPLLAQPIKRSTLLYGKMTAISLFSGLSLLLLMILLYFLLPLIPFDELGLDLEIQAFQFSLMFIICLPIILFSSALLAVVGSFTKTFKEAQTYLSFMIVLPTLPIIIAQLLNAETSLLIMPIPSLAQSTLITDIIEQGTLDWVQTAVSIVTTTLYAWLLARLAIFLYSREQIVN